MFVGLAELGIIVYCYRRDTVQLCIVKHIYSF